MRDGTGRGGRYHWGKPGRKTSRICRNVVALWKRENEKHEMLGNLVRAFQRSRTARFWPGFGLENETPCFVGPVFFHVAGAHKISITQHLCGCGPPTGWFCDSAGFLARGEKYVGDRALLLQPPPPSTPVEVGWGTHVLFRDKGKGKYRSELLTQMAARRT